MSGDPFLARVMTIFIKHVFFANVGKVGESDPVSSDPLSSDPSLARSIARSLARSLARSIARSLDRSIVRLLTQSLARSLDRPLARSIARAREGGLRLPVRSLGGGEKTYLLKRSS